MCKLNRSQRGVLQYLVRVTDHASVLPDRPLRPQGVPRVLREAIPRVLQEQLAIPEEAAAAEPARHPGAIVQEGAATVVKPFLAKNPGKNLNSLGTG